MKRTLLVVLVIVIASFCFAQAPAMNLQNREVFRAGQLIAFVPADGQSPDNTLETWGYAVTRREVNFGTFKLCMYQALDRDGAKNVKEAVQLFNNEMRDNSGVKLLPNVIFHINGDPLFNRTHTYKDKEGNAHQMLLQWDMHNTGEHNGVAGADLNVQDAWKLIPNNHETVIVAVIDSGVDVDHPGLKGRIYKKNGKIIGKDFTDMWGGAGDFHDDHGHGSHCAGSIAAGHNDNEGITGSSGPANVKIMPVKVMAKDGSGDLFSITDGIKWAAEQNAHVLSMSIGAVPLWPEQEPALKEAFDSIFNAPVMKNIIPIAAAGNNGKDIHSFPAFCDKVIAIGASDNQDKLAEFSNFGNWVDVVSPGVNIVSIRAKHKGKYLDMYQDAGHKKAEYAVGNGEKEPYDNRGYFIASGTSMACPNAVGVVAMMLAVNPNLKTKTEVIRTLLMKTSDKKGTFKIKANGGRINALKVVETAKAYK